jgi:hypothetical protein
MVHLVGKESPELGDAHCDALAEQGIQEKEQLEQSCK